MKMVVEALGPALLVVGGGYGVNVLIAVLVAVTTRDASRRRAALTALRMLLKRSSK